MAEKNKKKVRTITGGYAPDRRSQGQKHGEAAKKKKAQAGYQKKQLDLLTNDGKGTPRKKVKSVGVGKTKPKKRTFGPKQNKIEAPKLKLQKREYAKSVNAGIKKAEPKKKADGGIKSSESYKKTKAAEVKRAAHKKARQESGVSDEKYSRLTKKKNKLEKRAAEAGSTSRKGIRLAKRAKRKEERAAGKRKSGFGTALAKVGRGAFGGLAVLGGSTAAAKKAGSKGAFFKKKAHEK